MTLHHQQRLPRAFLAGLAACTAACPGGGGGSSPTPGTPEAEVSAKAEPVGDVAADLQEGDEVPGGEALADGSLTPDTSVCNPACELGFMCIRGACLSTCEGTVDVAALVAPLGPDLFPAAHYCGPTPGAYGYDVTADGQVLEAVALPGEGVTDLLVVRWPLDLGPAGLTLVGRRTLAGLARRWQVLLAPYVAIDPAGSTVAVGYTRPDGSGEVLYGPLVAAATPEGLDLSGFSCASSAGVAVLGPTTFLVAASSALGAVEGPGLYLVELSGDAHAVRVAANAGVALSGLVRHQDLVLVAGYADPWPAGCDGLADPPAGAGGSGERIFALSLAALQEVAAAGGAPLDAFCTAPQPAGLDALPMALAPDRMLVESGAGFAWRSWLWEPPGAFELGAIAPLLDTGSTFDTARLRPATAELVVRHTAGYLWVGPAGTAPPAAEAEGTAEAPDAEVGPADGDLGTAATLDTAPDGDDGEP